MAEKSNESLTKEQLITKVEKLEERLANLEKKHESRSDPPAKSSRAPAKEEAPKEAPKEQPKPKEANDGKWHFT